MSDEKKMDQKENTAAGRREFLKKSAYAACATPVIVSMLVERAEAGRPKPSSGINAATPPANSPDTNQ